MRVGDVRPARLAVRAEVEIPRSVDRDLVLVRALGHVEGAGPDAVGTERQRRRLAVGLPVARASHLGVVAARHGHRVVDGRLAAVAPVIDGAVHGDADRGVGGCCGTVSGRIDRHGAVLHEGASGEPASVVEHARGRVFGGAERGPFVVAGDAERDARLDPGVLVDIGDDGREAGDRGTRGRGGQRDRERRLGRSHGGARDPDDRAERRNGDRHEAVGVAVDRRGVAVEHREGCVGRQRRHLNSARLGRVVHGDQVLDLLVAVDAAEGVDARALRREALDLGSGLQRRSRCAQLGEVGDDPVHRGVGVEAVDAVRVLAGDERLVRVFVRLRREERLTRILIAAGAGEALLVAVVDDGLAAGQVHELVRELGALQGVSGRGEEVADAAHVVVAEEGRQRGRRRVGRRVVVVTVEQLTQAHGRVAARERGGARLEGEVEHRVHVGVAHVRRELHRVGVVDLTKHEEVGLARDVAGVVEHLGGPGLPELKVHVLGGVDAEAVDTEVDPVLIHLDEAVDDGRVLGHQVVEADEVAVRDRLARPRRVAAVVVERRVIQPGRNLDVLVALGDNRRVREARGRVERGPVLRARERGDVDDVPGGIPVRRVRDVDVRVRALLVADHVGGVVRDDVEVDLDIAGVRLGDQRLKLGVRAEVRVELGEVGDPVAVVAGRGVRTLALHRLVLEARREPNGGRAEALDVVEVLAHARDVTAVVEALVARVEAGHHAVTLEPSLVVRGVAVREAVRHDEVEVLGAARLTHGRGDDGGVGVGVRALDAQQFETDALGCRIERDPDARVTRRRQRHVVGAPVQPPGRIPRVVRGDLVVVATGGQVELGRVQAGCRGRGELGRGAVGSPVGVAAELGLQAADQGVGVGRFVGHGGGQNAGAECGENECARGERGEGGAGGRAVRHASTLTSWHGIVPLRGERGLTLVGIRCCCKRLHTGHVFPAQPRHTRGGISGLSHKRGPRFQACCAPACKRRRAPDQWSGARRAMVDQMPLYEWSPSKNRFTIV